MEEIKKAEEEHQKHVEEVKAQEEKRRIEAEEKVKEEKRLEEEKIQREEEEKRAALEAQRYSPEPPKVEFLSNDEDFADLPPGIDKEELKRDRLRKETKAEEEAVKKAAALRAKEEEELQKQKNTMGDMENIAASILSKYS